ncbi:MAG TPA: ABC transporter permease [Opitutaceae bacterium]|nr:ABC transporter permease [Opitutaceae bacterium]
MLKGLAYLRRLGSRIASVFTGRRADASMSDEMRSHIDLQAEEYVKDGMAPADAIARATREFGHVDGVQETCRDERGFPWVSQLAQDLKYGVRMLVRSPGFTCVAVLTLGLGIGVNAGVFSLMDEVLLKQLPVKDPAGLTLFRWASPKDFPVPVDGTFEPDPSTKLTTCSSFTTTVFERFKAQGKLLDGVCAFCGLEQSTLVIDGKAESVEQGEMVSGDFFNVLGLPPEIGRVIEAGDDRPGAQGVAMISHRYWVRRFGADPSVVGKSFTVNGSPVTIVGVTASRFTGTLEVGDYPDVYLPLSFSEKMGREYLGTAKNAATLWWLQILARPQAGVPRSQVTAALEGILRQAAVESLAALKAQVPPSQGRELILIGSPGGQGLTEIRNQYRQQLAILVALAASILAIACANIANLLLARGAARQREIGVRLAMGAERGRIVRQLFTESALLALLGGALAVPLAFWTESFLVTMHPDVEGHTLQLHSGLDGRVFAAAAVIAMATSLAFGLLPALRASSVDVTAEFQGGTNNRGNGSRSRLGKAFLVIQIALSLILVVGAGLLSRTLRNLGRVDIGFDRQNIVLFELDPNPSGANFGEAEKVNRAVAERLRSVPGVVSATFSKVSLLSGRGWNSMLRPRRASGVHREFMPTMLNPVGPGFFSTYGIPVLRGREFEERDQKGRTVVVINQAMARECFGEADPVGQFLEEQDTPGSWHPIEVIGVSRDTGYDGLRRGSPPTAYFDFGYSEGMGSAKATFAVRVTGNTAAAAALVREAIQEAYPLLPVTDLRTQASQIEDLSANERMFARLSLMFSLLGVGLVSLGLYGLMSYTVLRRTSEIGLRMALGATPGSMVWMVLRECILVVAIGLGIGLAGAFASVRLLSSLLYGLSANDPVTYAAAVLALLVIGLVAGWLPARRAAKLDPMIALRCD